MFSTVRLEYQIRNLFDFYRRYLADNLMKKKLLRIACLVLLKTKEISWRNEIKTIFCKSSTAIRSDQFAALGILYCKNFANHKRENFFGLSLHTNNLFWRRIRVLFFFILNLFESALFWISYCSQLLFYQTKFELKLWLQYIGLSSNWLTTL